ncbi:oleate hydratase [Corynebacterium kroppenstedtii]|nr:oleate hydratase [Corynebacterium kroppenstedtii]
MWESISFNFYDGYDNPFTAKIRELTDRDVFNGRVVNAGIITADDSSWLCSLTVHRQPQFPGQQDGLCVV